MKWRTGRWSAGVLAVLLPVGTLVGAVGIALGPTAAAASRPAQAATTVPPAGNAPATTVQAPAPTLETTVPVSPPSVPVADQVGDPAADRRIRNIVLALGALALIVLITTIIFWRKTKPVPAALDGLRRLGTRSGRRAALAVEAAGVAPPSVAGDGVARPGVSIRPAAAVAVAEGASMADGGGSAGGGAPVADGDARAGVGSASMADAEVPVERNGAPLPAPPEPEPSAVERVSSAVEPAAGPESIVSAAPPADVVPASSDEPGPAPAVPGPPPAVTGPAPAAEVVPASAPPPSPGTSLRKDG